MPGQKKTGPLKKGKKGLAQTGLWAVVAGVLSEMDSRLRVRLAAGGFKEGKGERYQGRSRSPSHSLQQWEKEQRK